MKMLCYVVVCFRLVCSLCLVTCSCRDLRKTHLTVQNHLRFPNEKRGPCPQYRRDGEPTSRSRDSENLCSVCGTSHSRNGVDSERPRHPSSESCRSESFATACLDCYIDYSFGYGGSRCCCSTDCSSHSDSNWAGFEDHLDDQWAENNELSKADLDGKFIESGRPVDIETFSTLYVSWSC